MESINPLVSADEAVEVIWRPAASSRNGEVIDALIVRGIGEVRIANVNGDVYVEGAVHLIGGKVHEIYVSGESSARIEKATGGSARGNALLVVGDREYKCIEREFSILYESGQLKLDYNESSNTLLIEGEGYIKIEARCNLILRGEVECSANKQVQGSVYVGDEAKFSGKINGNLFAPSRILNSVEEVTGFRVQNLKIEEKIKW